MDPEFPEGPILHLPCGKWAAASAQPAYSVPVEGAPQDLSEARQEYEKWMDRAGIPVASEDARARAAARLLAPLRREEFDRHLNKRAGMAAGLDGTTWGLLQALSDDSKQRVFLTMQNFMKEGYDPAHGEWTNFPEWFRTSWQSVVPKRNCDGTLARHRGISVTPALGRLLG